MKKDYIIEIEEVDYSKSGKKFPTDRGGKKTRNNSPPVKLPEIRQSHVLNDDPSQKTFISVAKLNHPQRASPSPRPSPR